MPKPGDRQPLPIDLALQGGGAHGAFTWGVLDRLLGDLAARIDGVSGTSAGAMNAAVLASAYAVGGAERARTALEAFWRSVSRAALLSPFQRGPLDILLDRWTLDNSPMFIAMDLMARLISPYDLNPFGSNPRPGSQRRRGLRGVGERTDQGSRAATSVRTGRGRVFRNQEITAQVLLASACLPSLFQAIEIDGEPYWDGGDAGILPSRPWCVNACGTRSWSR